MIRAKRRDHHRASTRRSVRQPAAIAELDGQISTTCTMMDVSAGGARLRLAAPQELPDEFFLVLSPNGHARRRCRIVWRSPTAVGVRFLVDRQPTS